MTQITFSLQLLHVEIESVVVPTVAVAVEIAAIYLLLGVVVLLGVAVLLAVNSFELAVEIAHGRSFDTSVEALGELFVDNAIPGHANDAPYIHFSILKALFHKRMEHHYSMPTLSGNFVSDTSVHPTDATTTHRRRTSPRLNQGQRKHRFEAGGPLLEAPSIQLGEEERCQFVPIPAPLLE